MISNTSHPDADSLNSLWVMLDTEDQWKAFSQPVGDGANQALVQSSLLLDGLRCAACSGIVERGLSALPGVVSARVSLSKNRAVVVWRPEKTRPSKILAAIHALGYRAIPASQNESHLSATQKSRAAFWRWLVAGFSMMQVMMYASPSYFTKAGDITPDLLLLLNWASWLLTLPVLMFSSSPFFSQALRDLKQGQISMDLPVAMGIAMTFVVSSAATFDPSGWWGDKVYFDSLTMFVFFLLSARLIEVKLHSKTLGAMEVLLSRIPESIERQNADGSFTRVLNSQLKVGDIARVHLGEAFPADGKLVFGDTRADESLLTGEFTPVSKSIHDNVVAGSYNLGQTVHMAVEVMGESTRYGQLIQLINQAAIEKPRLSQLADRVARPFLMMVILSALAAAALLWNVDHARALMTAAAVLIVTCPCALSLATPAAMLASAGAFLKRGILIRRLQAIESIADIDTVIFDKTGTLTLDHIEMKSIRCRSGLSESMMLAIAATLARHSMHPVSRALVGAYQQAPQYTKAVQLFDIKEIIGSGLSARLNTDPFFKGVLGESIQLGSAKFCGVDKLCAVDFLRESSQQVFLADEQGWLATFDLQEALKPHVAVVIKWLQDAHLQVELLSGDQAHTVSSTAHEIGITQFQAACSPQDKLSRLQVLKQQNKKILMVGDGLNDGPILASAHVSIAMGKGVPLALAHADYILLNGDIGQIPQLMSHARKTMTIIKQNIAWAVVYNMVCIPLAFFGILSAWLAGLGMAVSSLIVLANALRLTTFSASPNLKFK